MILGLLLLLWYLPFSPDSISYVDHYWYVDTIYFITPDSLASNYRFAIHDHDTAKFWLAGDSTGWLDSVRMEK